MPDSYKLQYDGMTLTYPGWNGCLSYENSEVAYNLYLQQQEGGTITADKLSGFNGEIITLSNTPDAGYQFNSYGVTGAVLTGNQFTFDGYDVSAEANFEEAVYTLTLQTDGHGTIAATHTTGHAGDTVTLSNTYKTYYRFNNYTQTGGNLNGSTFTFGNQNATAKANFKVNSFTATGDFGSCVTSGKTGAANCTANSILRAHTGSWPSNWPANGSVWSVSNASAYGVKANTTWEFGSNSKIYITGYGCVVLNGTIKKSANATINADVNSKTFTSNMAVNSQQGKLTISGRKNPKSSTYTNYIKKTAGSWTATGYAP